MQSWDDDAAAFYERSLGDIVNGADLPAGATSRRTGALYIASNSPRRPPPPTTAAGSRCATARTATPWR